MVRPSFHVRPTWARRLAGARLADLLAIVVAMSKRTSSHVTRRPLRTLLLAALVGAIALAVRAAVADKGGSYDPADSLR